MEQHDSSQDFDSKSSNSDGLNIDFKRILFRTLRYWYILLLSLAIALTIAFLRNRYATRIYPVTASIIIKEAEDVSGAELLYNNPLVSFKRNYLNELYIIRSYPLIQSVLEELNFGVSFYKEGNFLVTEAYEYIPVETIIVNRSDDRKVNAFFTIVNEKQFLLSASGERTEPSSNVFSFGDTIKYEGAEFIFNVKPLAVLQDYIDETFIFTYAPTKYITDDYVKKLSASWSEEGAGVIDLSLIGPNPKKDKDFLYGLIKRYQDYDLEKKNQSASRTVTFISEQLQGISDSLRYVEAQLERFKNKNVVTDLDGEALRLYKKLEEIEAQKTSLILSSNYYKYLTDYIKKDENLDQIILPSSVGITDPILTQLVSSMAEIQLEIKLSNRPENPAYVEARNRVQSLKGDIIEAIKNQQHTDGLKHDYLSKQSSLVEKQLGYLPVAERTLISIQRNYTLLENLYIFLLQKRSEAAISKASSTSDIVVVNPPMQAGKPITPKTVQNYLFAAFAGISLPILIFVLLEIFNIRIQSKEDIERLTTIPIIGGVGHKSTANNLEVLLHPKSSIAESFRALRSNLNYFIGKKENALFLITSSISGEGKTFTSINLASVLALSGKKTLIVGADMRRPKIFDDFNLVNDVGLSTYLAGIAEFDMVAQKLSFPFLDLVSGGPVPPNPSELLLTERMKSFIEEAKKRYDYIVIDSPPLAMVADAFVLSEYADHTIFLVRQNYTPKELLKAAQDFFSQGKLKNISIVLNDIYRSGPGYGYGYNYSYRYGYGYGSEKHMNSYYSDEQIDISKR